MSARGANPAAVLEAIRARAARGEAGGRASDGRRIGLVIEGGAMRGVVSAGALIGLEELGFTRLFDEVYGCSAGAVNASYFLAGQAAFGTTIYYENINNARFINPWRWRRIVDVDFLFDTVVPHEKPLLVDRILASPSRLLISITDAGTGEAFLVDPRSTPVPFLTLLRASCALPVLYNKFIDVEGRACLDGGCANPIPVADAIARGCTDVLVLLSRPVGFVERALAGWERAAFSRYCARGNAKLMTTIMGVHDQGNASRDLALGRRAAPAGANVATFCPEDDEPTIARTERDGRKLRDAASRSALRVLRAFGRSDARLVDVLRAFPER